MFEAIGSLFLLAAGLVSDPAEWLRAADAPRHVLQEGVIRIHAVVEEKGKPPSESDLDVYVKGGDRALCVFREGRQKGRKVLMVGERVWLLVPGTKKPIPVSGNQRLVGAASIADVARLSFADEFTGDLRQLEEKVDEVPCRVLDLKAKTPKASYASGTLWVGRQDRLLRKARLALRSGKEAKEIRFTAYGKDGGKTVLRRMEIHHLLSSERGMVTTLDFLGYERKPLDPSVFEPAGARDPV